MSTVRARAASLPRLHGRARDGLRDQIGLERAKRLAEPARSTRRRVARRAREQSRLLQRGRLSVDAPPAGERTSVIGLFGASVSSSCRSNSATNWPASWKPAESAIRSRGGPELRTGRHEAAAEPCGADISCALGQRIDAAVLDGRVRAGRAVVSQRAARLRSPTRRASRTSGRSKQTSADLRSTEAWIPTTKPPVAERSSPPWERSTRQFHLVCRAQQIPLVHLLQPNQYDGSAVRAPSNAASRRRPTRRSAEASSWCFRGYAKRRGR